MANVLIGVTVVDGEGKTKNVVLYADPAVIDTAAEALAIANGLSVALANNINGGVQEAYVQFPLAITIPYNPTVESRVGTGGNLTFEDAIGKQYSVYIPSLKNTKVVNGLVNIDDAEIISLGEVFTETTGIRTPHQHDIVTLVGGKQVN